MAVPMIHSTMRMAEDLAMAMESRCYQGVRRTSMFELKMHKADCFFSIHCGMYGDLFLLFLDRTVNYMNDCSYVHVHVPLMYG
jgi:energy-coupling factor transporter transmembrane protein EcfT